MVVNKRVVLLPLSALLLILWQVKFRVRWCTFGTLALGRQRKEDWEFEARLDYPLWPVPDPIQGKLSMCDYITLDGRARSGRISPLSSLAWMTPSPTVEVFSFQCYTALPAVKF